MTQSSLASRPVSAEVVQANQNRKFGVWLFLSSELLIFAGLIVGFVLMRVSAYEQGLEWWHANLFSLFLVSANTFILLTSSLMVVLGIEAIWRGEQAKLRRYLIITAALGVVFVLGQAVEWALLFSEGHSFAEPFGSAFFTLTGLHGLHVVVGVIWCLILVGVARRGVYSARNYTSIDIFGLYWHFVDLVWIIIFTVVYLTHLPTPK